MKKIKLEIIHLKKKKKKKKERNGNYPLRLFMKIILN